ncbi:MAG: glycosyltransferase family 9 protein [Deltaproteobacteria bacterium]|nr:glycosyltransferase family 9 protein [Deltaproteobacteria bacterium]
MKLLIIRPGALGDTLMLLPSVIHLGSHAQISFLGRHPGISFLSAWTHKCIDLDGSVGQLLFSQETGERPPNLPDSDVVLVFMKDHDGSVERNLRRWFRRASIHFYPSLPGEGEDCHVALYVARCFHMSSLPISPREAVSDVDTHPPFRSVHHGNRPPVIVFHPGSGSERKNHPPGFWLNLIERFQESVSGSEVNFVILLGPAEEALISLFSERFKAKSVKVCMSTESNTLISLLQEASLYIGHDSGVTHLAAMHGIATIALFKDSSLEQWRPLGPRVRVVFGREAHAGLIDETLCAARQSKSLSLKPSS